MPVSVPSRRVSDRARHSVGYYLRRQAAHPEQPDGDTSTVSLKFTRENDEMQSREILLGLRKLHLILSARNTGKTHEQE